MSFGCRMVNLYHTTKVGLMQSDFHCLYFWLSNFFLTLKRVYCSLRPQSLRPDYVPKLHGYPEFEETEIGGVPSVFYQGRERLPR